VSDQPEDDAHDGGIRPDRPGRAPFGGDRAANSFERFFPGPARLDPKIAARIDAIGRARGRAPGGRQSSSARRQVRPGETEDGAP
jgi:hypothetical protein